MRTSLIGFLLLIVLIGVLLNVRLRMEDHSPAVAQVAPQQRATRRAAPPEAPKAPSPPVVDKRAEPKVASVPGKKVIWDKEVAGEAQITSQAARQDALEWAGRALGEYLRERFAGFRWIPTPEFINDNKMIAEEKEEEQRLNDVDAPLMVRFKLKVELREPQLKLALQEDRKLRVESRLWQAGRGLGGFLIILAAVVGYLRLDDWTKGYLSLPLKLTALAVALAGPAAVWWLI